ncbi:MAG: hypothetical protein NTW01_02620 [Gammaproteobacteria bacterium]|nr:hypothetical protein [Gammaproteobacteria bacterium]
MLTHRARRRAVAVGLLLMLLAMRPSGAATDPAPELQLLVFGSTDCLACEATADALAADAALARNAFAEATGCVDSLPLVLATADLLASRAPPQAS